MKKKAVRMVTGPADMAVRTFVTLSVGPLTFYFGYWNYVSSLECTSE